MRNGKALLLLAGCAFIAGQGTSITQTINLPSGKQLIGEAPGHPQKLNSLPMSMIVSPDRRYVVTVNTGYGTYESKYLESLAVLDASTGTIADFPDERTSIRDKQTLYSGLAFSRDGAHLYASMASYSDPEGDGKKAVGNGIVVYSFNAGKIAPERFIPLPLQPLAPGRKTWLVGDRAGDKAVPYPAAIAVVASGGAEKLLVADNFADNIVLVDAASGKIEKRFDLSEYDAVPGTFPIDLVVALDGKRAFAALWNASEVVELNLDLGTVGRKLALMRPSSPIATGSHPSALALAPNGKTLYVALENRDAVAAVNVGAGVFALKGYFGVRMPGQSYFGAEPVALAVNGDGAKLYVANLSSDSVAVVKTDALKAGSAKQKIVAPIGFIPTEWMPMSMAFIPSPNGGKLYIATAKGKGTGPNNFPMRAVPGEPTPHSPYGGGTYIGALLYGSLATLSEAEITSHLSEWTPVVLASNLMRAEQKQIVFADGTQNRIKHVIYIIKENRTYDQIFGDLALDGKRVGNGDPGLAMYGAAVTPNEHKLALQFGVLDNFYDSGEVSGDGHFWSTAGISSDYLEKSWQQAYHNGQHLHDYTGVVEKYFPLQQKIPDVNEPVSGYLWNNLAAHGKTYYHFGEFITSVYCNEHAVLDPGTGPIVSGPSCVHKFYSPGEALPEAWGGGTNKWPWPIPVLAGNTATKPELQGHFAPEMPSFNLRVPDQLRANVFLHHLKGWIADREAGNDTMPNFILMWLSDDHTAGTTAGGPAPKSSVADNDLALGRMVETVSHSPYWEDTAFFVLEDDAQNGADHVDAHRSIALVVSKYAPRGPQQTPFVDSTFYTTVSVIRTMESLLGLPPMNNNDAFCSQMTGLFTGPGNQPPYTADYSNRDNGLIYTANAPNAVGAKESARMDFTHEDRAPAERLNVILWKDAMGASPVPAMVKAHSDKAKKDDDDD